MKIVLDIPDEVAQAPAFAKDSWLREIAIALYEQKRVTLGSASQIAEMHLMEFQKYLGRCGGCIHYDVDEFDADIQNLRNRKWL